MQSQLLFFIALSFLLVHEMDAIRCKEWRIFPLLSLMNDKWGEIVFIFAHIPLFILLFFQLANIDANPNFILGMDIFFIIHTFLHLFYLKNKSNLFKDWISWTAILGAGIFGFVDFVFLYF